MGVVILTGAGDEAFCSAETSASEGKAGTRATTSRASTCSTSRSGSARCRSRWSRWSRFAIGGGHVLHVMCDLTIAAENARFGQTGPKVGSFDGGFGSSYLARMVGQKKAREIWFLCRQYDAKQALDMGLVNAVVPLERLEEETVAWCREMLAMSPMALRCIKAALNADCDGQAGLQELAGNATLLYYMSEEAQEGRDAYLERRKPNFGKFRRLP